MASETATGSNIEIVWEYTERVFNQHSPDLAAKYLAPGVTWHGQTLLSDPGQGCGAQIF
jgi:hypothetical protein